MYVDRTYRDNFSDDMVRFRVVVKDTDLLIKVDRASYSIELEQKAERKTMFFRTQLEEYIALDPDFKTTLTPHIGLSATPPIGLTMLQAGNQCNVGPMAAVAGAMAEAVGKYLRRYVQEVIVENGGDLYIDTAKDCTVGIFAGKSLFSNKVALRVPIAAQPLGICTSSGTVGPSLSFGKADAVVITATSAALADAAASAVGNVVQTKADVKTGVDLAKTIAGLRGAVVIKDDQMAAWGDVEIVPIKY